jgi:hypothetical protein
MKPRQLKVSIDQTALILINDFQGRLLVNAAMHNEFGNKPLTFGPSDAIHSSGFEMGFHCTSQRRD